MLVVSYHFGESYKQVYLG